MDLFEQPFRISCSNTRNAKSFAQPVSIAPYNVTLSKFTGASVNAVLKSETNIVQGTVYGFFRNQDFTGGKIKGESIFMLKLSQSQVGVRIGASLLKDKLFVFINSEKDD
jgi:hypothetical protein